jgi:predicted AAA+ superfamily ATPase
MYKRKITPNISEAIADTPAIIINGPRQSGKTTLVKSLKSPSFKPDYYSFDDSGILATAQLDPQGFIQGIKTPVILDEIQRVPELMTAIKCSIDKDRRPGRFLLTGSANVLQLPKLSDSLAGRVELFDLWPLAQAEIESAKSDLLNKLFSGRFPKTFKPNVRKELIKRIFQGGYPEAMTRVGRRQESWFASYIKTILQRDITEISDIQSPAKLTRLLSLLATRTASIINLSDISSATEIPYATLNRYIDLLQLTYLLVLVPAWSSNLGLRLVKAPKLLLNDTGLLASLLAVNPERFQKEPSLFGIILETFVGMELKKIISYSSDRFNLFHYRTLDRHEVDFIVEKGDGKIIGIEVKASSTIGPSDLKGLKNLATTSKGNLQRGIVLYGGDQILPLGDRLVALPISVLWS